MDSYEACTLCPHRCLVNRVKGERGVCNESATVRIAWAGLHRGEEPPISGEAGSGMIFFSGCPLHCATCQNRQISARDGYGLEIGLEELSTLMLALQEMETKTLNLVTGTHFIPSIVEALIGAKKRGLNLDVVWNSSGFESVEGLSLVDPYVDLYLIDLKTLDEGVARRFCGTVRYQRSIRTVFDHLIQKRRNTFIDDDGLLKGVLVRHLLFPGEFKATEEVLRYFADHLKESMHLSLMVQFEDPEGTDRFPKVSQEEYDRLLELLEELKIENGFVQEIEDSISWIPDFTKDEPFPPTFSEVCPYFLELRRL
ncbi:MAG: radical SAM protein [Spirochaetales bacterium]|nr:radical SAM protein [Spirochaetales bacterium]